MKSSWIIAVVAALAITGCQTTGTQGVNSSTSQFKVAKESYSLFFDQKDHLIELITAENFEDASILYEEQRSFFDANKAEDAELNNALEQVVEKISRVLEPEIAQTRADLKSITWPAPSSEWEGIRVKLRHADRILSITPKDGIFVNPVYASEGLADLKAEKAGRLAEVIATEVADFQSFDHFSGTNFFAFHPAQTGSRAFFDAHPEALTSLLTGAKADEILAFGRAMDRNSISDTAWGEISRGYADARLARMSPKSRSMSDVLQVINEAQSVGFTVDALSSVKIGFVEVTSRTLLKQGQVEFPAEIEVDLPFDIEKAELDQAFDTTLANTSDYLIVFDVALAKTRRKVGKMKNTRSEFVAGYDKRQNPEYMRLQNEVTTKQMEVQNHAMRVSSANAQYCYGLACLGKIASVAVAASARDEAQEQLLETMTEFNQTPIMIDVPIMQNYNFNVGAVTSQKTMTVHYYVIDKAKKRYFKSTFDVIENEKFSVAYNVNPNDPKRTTHISNNDTEEDVAAWEEKPSSVKLSQLIDHYLANESEAKPLKSLTAIRREMLKDRNTAIASYKENTFEESTKNDPRFDSVVAIYSPDGTLGSGFFVRPDVVMTNYHVVGEGDFMELKMHDERETFGKVIARDAMLDLALIKVQNRGVPVAFFKNNKIDLGSTVEVIGHPRGFEFSITRGVVSAIRKRKSVVLGAGSDVLFVQVDAPTSPGNSGGPVFLDDQVVSVVSWGRVDTGSQNLNFSVHHSEAERFLKESLGSGS